MNTERESPFQLKTPPLSERLAKFLMFMRSACVAALQHVARIPAVISDATRGTAQERWFAAEFDEEFYLRMYPDVAESGMDAHQHYLLHGKTEGRQGARLQLELVPGRISHDRQKPTILIVSHEASLTGAPILSLNLVRGLQTKYNVIAMLLGDGPLMDAFRMDCVSVVGLRRGISEAQVNDTVTQLVEAHQITYAIANSVETWTVLEALAKGSVPSLVLVHEFAAYTRPSRKFFASFFWADEVVFSTKLTYESVVSEYPQLAAKNCRFIQQGRCVLLAAESDTARLDKETARIKAVLRPACAPAESLVVLGVGFVQLRKGVELFIDCAAKVKRAMGGRPCRFVWVGHGYNPDSDMEYSVYLADQIQRLGLQSDVHFLGDTFLIEEVYEQSDMLLLTSRLDPLPGVAIEAMSHGLPVICFDKTTGIADVLTQHGVGEDCVVPYLDTDAMANKVVAFADSNSLRQKIGLQLKEIAANYFNMDRYIETLDTLALKAGEKVRLERKIAAEIFESGLAQRDYLAPSYYVGDEEEIVRWKYVRPWTAGFDRRQPNPEFHPGIYQEHQPNEMTLEPMVHYLRAGRPTGPWQHEVLTSSHEAQVLPDGLKVALHLHVYYSDLLPDILDRLDANRLRPDIFVSVPSREVKDSVQARLKKYRGTAVVEIVPNRGRDIGPFLTAFGPTFLRDYDIVGHLHTKKTADISDVAMSERWRTFLLENLLGRKANMADIIVAKMASDPTIGIVFPADPNVLGWGSNREFAEQLCYKLDLPEDLPEHFVFPVGTMFWARPKSLKRLLELELNWADYPPEPLPYDGSVLHALERLLPFVVEQAGDRCVVTNVPGVTR